MKKTLFTLIEKIYNESSYKILINNAYFDSELKKIQLKKEEFLLKDLTFENLKVQSGSCVICYDNTRVKGYYKKNGKRHPIFWELCESCKFIQNCFTCQYSKCWYLRYRGRCDITFTAFVTDDFSKETLTANRRKFENEHPDCCLYKTKKIGNIVRDFWEAVPCGRYRRGDATLREYIESNMD